MAYPRSRSRRWAFVDAPIFDARDEVAAAGERIYAGHGSERKVEVFRPQGGLEGLVRWTGKDRTVSPAEIERYRDDLLAGAAPPDERRALVRQLEEQPVADRFPSLDRILADRSGRVWVREYERPSWEGGERWLVFDREGRFLCRARMPERLEVMEAGPDHVLGVWRDDLDVERVRVYELREPRGA